METCKACGEKIVVMCQKNTIVCSQNCARALWPERFEKKINSFVDWAKFWNSLSEKSQREYARLFPKR